MSRLRVVVPAPAYWSLTLDGVPHPVGEWAPVTPGPVRVALRVCVPVPGRQLDGVLGCVVDVQPRADHEVEVPLPYYLRPEPSSTAS